MKNIKRIVKAMLKGYAVCCVVQWFIITLAYQGALIRRALLGNTQSVMHKALSSPYRWTWEQVFEDILLVFGYGFENVESEEKED